MPFALEPNADIKDIAAAVNYLLANFSGTVAANNYSGQVTGPQNSIISYLYKYLAIKYADSFDGTVNFSNSPTNRTYYGLYNSDDITESTDPTKYLWTEVTGGFGTTKVIWYVITGGRQIQFQIQATAPDERYQVAGLNSIDLDDIQTDLLSKIEAANLLAGTASNDAIQALDTLNRVTQELDLLALAPSAITDHNNLAGLQGGTSASYYHLTGSKYSQITAAPVTKTADFTLADTETWVINNKSGSTCTVTLPAASSWSGRVVHLQNYQAQTLVSASSNVVPRVGGSAGTAILAAVAGDTATLVSDGSSWIMTQYVPNNCLLLE